MKLLTKLTLFITLSKLLIVVLFVLLLPSLVNYASFQYSNYYLNQQKKKVLAVISENGVDYYLQGDSAFAIYDAKRGVYFFTSGRRNSGQGYYRNFTTRGWRRYIKL